MSMKYKLLLCVVVLLAFSAAAVYAGTVQVYKQDFSDPKTWDAGSGSTTPWTFQGNWAVTDQGAGSTTAKPNVPALGTSPNPALVYNKNGNYEPSALAKVTSAKIDCSKATSVTLSFDRSLTIEDYTYDKATVEVSNNGTDWTTIYKNPGDPTADTHTGDLFDPAWRNVSYDISAVADGKSAVQIRFGIASNGTNDHAGKGLTIPPGGVLAGWAIDNIVLSGAGPDAFYGTVLSGAVLPAGWYASGPIWQMGAPVAGGGQDETDFSTVPPTVTRVGRDPGVMPAGSPSTSEFGTVIGGAFNYPAGMSAAGVGINNAPQYLVWGPLDLTGLSKTAIRFQEWLNIGSGNLDKAAVQVHVNNTDLDNPDDPEVAQDVTTSATVNQAAPKKAYPLNTADHFAQGIPPSNNKFSVTIKFDTDNLAAGNAERVQFQYALDANASSPTWKAFTTGGVPVVTGTVTMTDGAVFANTDDGTNSGVDKAVFGATNFQGADYILAQNNPNFGVRVWISKNDGTDLDSASKATVVVSEVKVEGVLWKTVWSNPTGSETLTDIGDGKAAWALRTRDLSAYGADDNDSVMVRWSFGPTDSGFSTEYGGWNITDPALVEASREWAAQAMTTPAGLAWGKTSAVTVPAKNTGTATWDDSFTLYEVQGVLTTVPDVGEPGATLKVLSTPTSGALSNPITRWNVGSVDVSGTVAADAVYSFKPTVTAPPLSSIIYKTPVGLTAPADADLSKLDCDWNMASPTADGDITWLPTFRNTAIANKGIVTSRFPDIAPGTAGNWARYWIEELAGRVPMIVQGFPDGTYGPTIPITRDQIAVFMARANNYDTNPSSYPLPHFSDVPTDYWAYGSIEACAVHGVVTGFPDKTYQPLGGINRDAMAKFIVNGAGFTHLSGGFMVPNVNAPAAADKAAETAAMKAGWFSDVPLINDDGTGTAYPVGSAKASAFTFRDYIATLVNPAYNVVTGYPPIKNPDDTFTYFYGPDKAVTRDQLAVFVWRAFMRGAASAGNRPSFVVAGGPAITAVPLTTGAADYYGYTNAGKALTDGPFLGTKDKYTSALVSSTADSYAYVTLDAVRLNGLTAPINVVFSLQRVTGTTGAAVTSAPITIDATTASTWVSQIVAGTDGQPYRNVAWHVPTGLQGDFKLVVTVNGATMASPGQQPFFSVMNNMYTENFDDDATSALGRWTQFGLPFSPGPRIYPTSYTSTDVSTDTRKAEFKVLYYASAWDTGGSLELQGTQAEVRRFSTANRHNIKLSLRYAGLGTDLKTAFGSADAISVEWSPDYGSKGTAATWKTVTGFPLKGSAVPVKMQKDPVSFMLPNGDPNQSPAIVGADDRADFALRLSVSTTNTKLRAYFDTISIDGT